MINGNVKPDKLKGLKIPIPEDAGSRHHTLGHFEALDAMKKVVHDRGFEVGQVNVGMSASKMDALICIELVNETVNPVQRAWLGVLNCNSRKMKSSFYGGVVENGLGIVLAKYQDWKHSENLDFGEEVGLAVDELSLDMLKPFGKKLNALGKKEVSKQEADELMLKLARTNLLPWSGLRRIDSVTKGKKTLSALELLKVFSNATKDAEPVRMFVPRTDQLKRLWSFYRALTAKEPAFR